MKVIGDGYGLNDYNANLGKWLNTPVEVERARFGGVGSIRHVV